MLRGGEIPLHDNKSSNVAKFPNFKVFEVSELQRFKIVIPRLLLGTFDFRCLRCPTIIIFVESVPGISLNKLQVI